MTCDLVEALALVMLRERYGYQHRREEITPVERRTARAVLAMLKERGLKIVGREPTVYMTHVSSRGDGKRANIYWRRMWDAAPWVPGERHNG